MHEFYPSAGNLAGASQPHGLMAEHANLFWDIVTGQRDCRHLGGNNANNGPDRTATGVDIQCKYCATPKTSFKGFFGKGGELRYLSEETGVPMDMEVPADQYDLVVQRLQKQVAAGKVKVSGMLMTDAQVPNKLVRKGHYTYEDSQAMVKPGTWTSIKYDLQTSVAASAMAGGITIPAKLATSEWKDGKAGVACKEAAVAGASSTARAAGTHVVTCQVTRLGVPCAAIGVNAAYTVGNTAYDFCQGNTSIVQAERNVLKSAAGLVGGQTGARVGATLGAAILPVVALLLVGGLVPL